MCAGSGCGRVTFRPDENASQEVQPEKPPEKTAEKAYSTNGHAPVNGHQRNIAALFERVYKERLVYKAIAERDPNCPQLFEALKNNLEAKEDLLAALQTLPSMTVSE